MQLIIKSVRVLPLLLIRCQTILPEDDVVAHRQCEYRSSTGCDLAPAEPGLIQDTRKGTRLPFICAYCRQ